jgi:hypothetical protein
VRYELQGRGCQTYAAMAIIATQSSTPYQNIRLKKVVSRHEHANMSREAKIYLSVDFTTEKPRVSRVWKLVSGINIETSFDSSTLAHTVAASAQ